MHQTVVRGFGLGVPLDILGLMPLLTELAQKPVK